MEQTLGYRAVNRLDSGFVGSLGVLLISFRRSGVKLLIVVLSSDLSALLRSARTRETRTLLAEDLMLAIL